MRVYHFGDSAIFGDMRLIGQLYRPTIGILGCTQPKSLLPLFNAGAGTVLTGEMSADEAALAAEFLGVRYAIGTHYVDPDDEDVRRFLDAVPEADTTGARIPLALTAGQTLVIDGDSHRIEEPLGVTLPPTRVGVIGAGFWAGFQLAAWAEHANATVVAIANRSLGPARALAERFASRASTTTRANDRGRRYRCRGRHHRTRLACSHDPAGGGRRTRGHLPEAPGAEPGEAREMVAYASRVVSGCWSTRTSAGRHPSGSWRERCAQAPSDDPSGHASSSRPVFRCSRTSHSCETCPGSSCRMSASTCWTWPGSCSVRQAGCRRGSRPSRTGSGARMSPRCC